MEKGQKKRRYWLVPCCSPGHPTPNSDGGQSLEVPETQASVFHPLCGVFSILAGGPHKSHRQWRQSGTGFQKSHVTCQEFPSLSLMGFSELGRWPQRLLLLGRAFIYSVSHR